MLSAESEGYRRSRAGPGCLSFSASQFSSFDVAGVSSLKSMLIAALHTNSGSHMLVSVFQIQLLLVVG